MQSTARMFTGSISLSRTSPIEKRYHPVVRQNSIGIALVRRGPVTERLKVTSVAHQVEERDHPDSGMVGVVVLLPLSKRRSLPVTPCTHGATAARDDERSVLVLSQFTGAARELAEALIVNPYDLEEASSALASAITMPQEEQRDRMHSMRAFLAEFNVYRWAGRMLVDAARLRKKASILGRAGEELSRFAGLSQ